MFFPSALLFELFTCKLSLLRKTLQIQAWILVTPVGLIGDISLSLLCFIYIYIRATRQTARFPTNRGSEDQDIVSEDSNTGLSRNSSTETVIEVNQNREDVDKIVIKLDRLQDKSTRYESHKEFLEKCIREKVIPDGLRVDVEPTIGNHDEEF